MRNGFRWVFGIWSGVALLVACGGDEEATGPVALEPPQLRIVEFVSSSGSRVARGADTPLQLGCDSRLVVLVGPNPAPGQLFNWSLRPPGGCGGLTQCDYVRGVLTAEGSMLEVASATTALEFDLSSLPALPPSVDVQVELRTGDGTPFTLADAGVEASRVDLLAPEGCSRGGSGGTAGTGGAAGAAGSGGLSGAGGQGGGSGPGGSGGLGGGGGLGGTAGATGQAGAGAAPSVP